MAAHVEIRASTPTQDPVADADGMKVHPLAIGSGSATIANGASLSSAVDLGAYYMASRITMPAAWTAADLSFQVSADGTTYNEMRDSLGALVGFTVAASYDFALDPSLWLGVRYLKVRSGTAAAAVNQGAQREIVITKAPR